MKYSEVAKQYQKISKNQASAGEKLISMINFKGNESILDVGCGTGNLTSELSKKTSGSVVGIDPSEGMVQQANKFYGNLVNFYSKSAEEMDFILNFDIIFCNSVFHWFTNPTEVLEKIFIALKKHGKFFLQTPVKEWCDFLVAAIDETCDMPSIKKYFNYYKNPWFHLKNAKEYQNLLEANGFQVHLAQDETVTTENCDLEKILGFFNSGPALAYLNTDNYSIKWNEEYKNDFMATLTYIIKKKMDGNDHVNVKYNRAFLISEKNHL